MTLTKRYFLIGVLLLTSLVGGVLCVKHARIQKAVVLRGGKVLGPSSAPIVIEKFSDFQCPACQKGAEAIEQVLKKYPNQIQMIFYHFPLKMHPWAMIAHKAAECAARQGKFWPFYDKLYTRQGEWSKMKNPQEAFTQYAKELEIGNIFFDTCVSQNLTAEAVAEDVKKGKSLDIHSTPTFFVNGRRVAGFKLFNEQIDQIIKEELEKKLKTQGQK